VCENGTAANGRRSRRPPSTRPDRPPRLRHAGRHRALALFEQVFGRGHSRRRRGVVAGGPQNHDSILVDLAGGMQVRQRLERSGILLGGGDETALAVGPILNPASRPLIEKIAVPKRHAGQRVSLKAHSVSCGFSLKTSPCGAPVRRTRRPPLRTAAGTASNGVTSSLLMPPLTHRRSVEQVRVTCRRLAAFIGLGEHHIQGANYQHTDGGHQYSIVYVPWLGWTARP
jgi:hypothetical protein